MSIQKIKFRSQIQNVHGNSYDSLDNTCFLGLSVQMVCSLFDFVTCQTLKHTIRIKLKIDDNMYLI